MIKRTEQVTNLLQLLVRIKLMGQDTILLLLRHKKQRGQKGMSITQDGYFFLLLLLGFAIGEDNS